jgi:hypothetical protein
MSIQYLRQNLTLLNWWPCNIHPQLPSNPQDPLGLPHKLPGRKDRIRHWLLLWVLLDHVPRGFCPLMQAFLGNILRSHRICD